MKKLLLASSALGLFFASSAAYAADMPAYKAQPPVAAAYYNWSGFYLGGFVGGSFGRTDMNSVSLGLAGNTDLRGAGVLGGATVGLNYQVGYWVLGVEADYAWTNFNGNRTCPSTVALFSSQLTCHTRVDNIGTVAGRLGYAWDNVLVFAKGGGAWKRGSESITFNPTGQLFDRVTDDRSGWLVGGGLEFGFTPNWSAKVEYDYLDFGTKRVTGPLLPLFFDANVKEQIHAVKFGVNYRFGGYGPVYAKY
jgi:outer membrane immunogenic protein